MDHAPDRQHLDKLIISLGLEFVNVFSGHFPAWPTLSRLAIRSLTSTHRARWGAAPGVYSGEVSAPMVPRGKGASDAIEEEWEG